MNLTETKVQVKVKSFSRFRESYRKDLAMSKFQLGLWLGALKPSLAVNSHVFRY
jgi:hypothetical protein